MARNWDGLSDNYRHRLESHGISRNEYESGAVLSQARGHGLTRDALIAEIQGFKTDLFGDKRKWNEAKSLKHIDRNLDGHKRTTAELRAIANALRETRNQNHKEWMDSAFFQLREDDLDDAGFYN